MSDNSYILFHQLIKNYWRREAYRQVVDVYKYLQPSRCKSVARLIRHGYVSCPKCHSTCLEKTANNSRFIFCGSCANVFHFANGMVQKKSKHYVLAERAGLLNSLLAEYYSSKERASILRHYCLSPKERKLLSLLRLRYSDRIKFIPHNRNAEQANYIQEPAMVLQP